MFIVVTGTRRPSVELRGRCIELADECAEKHGGSLLVHGGCATGADFECSEQWDDRKMLQWRIEAPWREFRVAFPGKLTFESRTRNAKWKLAGPVRNSAIAGAVKAMLGAGLRGRGVAFPDAESKGTWDCVAKLRAVGLQVDIIEIKSH